MNARYARVSPISPPISDIRYEKPPSDTIPISDIENLAYHVHFHLLVCKIWTACITACYEQISKKLTVQKIDVSNPLVILVFVPIDDFSNYLYKCIKVNSCAYIFRLCWGLSHTEIFNVVLLCLTLSILFCLLCVCSLLPNSPSSIPRYWYLSAFSSNFSSTGY